MGRPKSSSGSRTVRRVPHPLVLVFVLLAAGIVAAGGFYSRNAGRRFRAEIEHQLSAVAELKTSELAQWRAERLGDASVFLENPALFALVRRVFDAPQDAEARAQLRTWLTKVQTHYPYDRLSLLDARGTERLAVPEGRAPISTVIERRLPEVLRSEGVAFEDFYRNEHDRRVYLSVLVPILDGRSRALGIVELRIDPEIYLYPLINRWPTPAQTGETLLVRRDGSDVLFLNELKFQKHTALTLRIPLANQDVVGVKAVLGQEGVAEGRDYRGVRVLAAGRAVPGSPWLLVARIHAAEVNAPLRERLWVMAVLVGGMLAAAAAAVGIVWREQRLRDLRERYDAERERAWLHDVVARSLNEVYVFDPETLRFRFVNAGACRNLGYTQEELAGLTPLDISPELTEETFRAMLEPRHTAESLIHVFETVHRRKDGSEYPAEVHLQLVDAGAGAVFLCIVDDITERRRAETRIRQLNRVYAVLSDVNQAIVRVREPQALFAEACRIAVETGGFRMAWVGLLDPGTKGVRPVAHAGVTDGYLDEPKVFPGDDARGLGPAASALREGRHEICNDIEDDPCTAAWREDALARGYRASAAFPLTVNGETVGIFTLYSSAPGFFDGEELRLLDEMAMDLTLAMEMGRLEETRLRLATALEQSPVSVFITGTEGRIEYVNPAFTSITGYAPEEALGGNPRMLKSGKQEPGLYQELWATITAGMRWRGELVNRRKNGSFYTQDLAIAPVRDAAGRVAHFVAISQDITERKRVEEEILKEKVFSDALLDSLPGIFYLFDHTGRFLRWNRSFETVSGYSAEEIAALRPLDFFTGDDRTLIEERVGKVFETGAADAEAALISKDGRRTPHYLAGRRITLDGVPCCIGTGIDVTARKHLEAQLQQSQKLEAIGSLAGGVAHDFNNILGVITGYGELAQRQLGPEHPARARVDEMVRGAERAAGLTRQLLAFSRKQVMQPRLLDLNGLVADTHKMLGRLIGEDVTVVVHPFPGLGTVKADPGQIEQVILNLGVNARDAMPRGGTLTLETANVDLDEGYAATHPVVKQGRHVMLTVSDTGIGMDEETQRRIFEPFFTTKPEGKGTGLGLATVYGIVRQCGGHIGVYSEPGRGTTFKVYLPRVDEPVKATPEAAGPAEAPHGKETILLVEDTEPLCEVVREMLEQQAYTVLATSGGEEALDLAREHTGPIHLLLTDVVMPKLCGAELAKRVAGLRPGIRILYMSGYTDDALSTQGVLGEGVALIEKPFTGDQLARAVREALDGPAAK